MPQAVLEALVLAPTGLDEGLGAACEPVVTLDALVVDVVLEGVA